MLNTRVKMFQKPKNRLCAEFLERRDLLSVDLVMDINTEVTSQMVDVDRTLFFTAATEETGLELWKSDEINAELVRDIARGPESSSPGQLLSVGGQLVFVIGDYSRGWTLWKSDGSEAGTVPFIELRFHSTLFEFGSEPTFSRLEYLTNFNGTLFFTIDDGVNGPELWTSDGTDIGTHMLKDIAPGPEGSHPSHLTTIGDLLYFNAHLPDSGKELWRTDGTPEGTWIIKDIYAGSDSSNPSRLTEVDGTAFFSADDGIAGRELWRTDGTPDGTFLVRDINVGSESSWPSDLTNHNGMLFFGANHSDAEFDWRRGREALWRSDGTEGGTVLVEEIEVSPYNLVRSPSMISAGEHLFFVVNDEATGRELWISDGTKAGTHIFLDLVPGRGSADIRSLMEIEDTIYFTVGDRETGRKLLKSDGTPDGTMTVTEFSIDASGWRLNKLTRVGDMLFYADTGADSQATLWSLDNALDAAEIVAGTYVLPNADSENNSHNHVVAGKNWFFTRYAEGGRQLWKSDGTKAGTQLLKRFPDAYLGRLSVYRDSLYFVVVQNRLEELWKSDGTPEGTVRVLAFDEGAYVWRMVATTDSVFLSVERTDGWSLWKSDGTADGTAGFRDFEGRAPELTVLKNNVYFNVADRREVDGELWKSDGTVGGTVMLSSGSTVETRAALGDHLFFVQFLSECDCWSLRKTDGTVEGTVTVSELPESWSSYTGDRPAPVSMNGNLFFWLDGEDRDRQLWKSDGTAAGTSLVRQFSWGDCISIFLCSAHWMESLDDQGVVLFSASDDSHGTELWRTDGTPDGTYQVKDIFAGDPPSILNPFGNPISNEHGQPLHARVGNHMFFTARDANSGYELWTSDGTEEGTYRVCDIKPGIDGSAPSDLTVRDDRLLFFAEDGIHGRELWAYDPDNVIPVPGDVNHDGVFDSSDLVLVFQAGEYEDNIRGNSTFEEGDWNGDGDFDTSDLVFAFQSGSYVKEVQPLELAAAIDSLFTLADKGQFTTDLSAWGEVLPSNQILHHFR